MTQDRIYSVPLNRVGDFEFDDDVADVFPDMIRRSVPGYASMLSMVAQTTQRFVQPNSYLYDLGCSLGACTMLLQQNAPAGCTVHAVDSAPAMISRLRERVAGSNPPDSAADIVVQQADVREVVIERASVVVLNLTLQFLPPPHRQSLLQTIAAGMLPGGALLLSEKICFEDQRQQKLMTDLHHDFKRAHGYSDLEIAQKRTAIENRLIPETVATHLNRLHEVGFACSAPWFQCFNFASFIAVK